MSYRNDHDAALARVEALEVDNARLAQENATLRAPAQVLPRALWLSPRKKALLGVVVIGAMGGIAAGVFAGTGRADRDEPSIESMNGKFSTLVHDRLANCALDLADNPHLDAERADPRAANPVAVSAIAKTTGCRGELSVMLSDGIISTTERDALARWLSAEEELDGTVSMILVYYGSDPYALDGYTSARQLWIEYDRAYFERNVALDSWRRTQ